MRDRRRKLRFGSGAANARLRLHQDTVSIVVTLDMGFTMRNGGKIATSGTYETQCS